jgi:hypothetical protein
MSVDPATRIDLERLTYLIRSILPSGPIAVFEYPEEGFSLFTDGHLIIRTELAEEFLDSDDAPDVAGRRDRVLQMWREKVPSFIPYRPEEPGYLCRAPSLFHAGEYYGRRFGELYFDERFVRIFDPALVWKVSSTGALPAIVEDENGGRAGLVMPLGDHLRFSAVPDSEVIGDGLIYDFPVVLDGGEPSEEAGQPEETRSADRAPTTGDEQRC